MTETIEIQGKQYAISGYAEDGLPIIQGVASSTQDGVDEDGNPKISVSISVPSVKIGLTPGEIK